MQAGWDPSVCVSLTEKVVYQTGDILSGRHTRNRHGEDVIEHQRRDAELCQRSAEGFFHDAVYATANEHRAALDVYRSHRERKQHHAEDEPWSGAPEGVLGDAAYIVGGRT